MDRPASPKLLSRDQFRDAVFARDNQRCVFCGAKAVDAHHILERRLWSDGGYYLNNGASVCAKHHLACERTTISVEDVRLACDITKPILPEHLYTDQSFDKWGNPILPNGMRMRGELFGDESVQKVLAEGNVLHLFADRVKYPRTFHLPWSDGMHDDDRMHASMASFNGKRVIVTTKMDGENTTLYRDGMHARSLDSRGGAERDWVKQFRSEIGHDIPEGWRVCGENLYAQHSIAYEGLESYFLGFSVWNERNICLSWDETIEWFKLLGITPVQVIFDDLYDEAAIRKLYDPKKDWARCEGYVLRLAEAFPYSRFRHSVGKYVRKDHVQTISHGWRRHLIPNQLADNN